MRKRAAALVVLTLMLLLSLIMPVHVDAASRTIVVPDDYSTIGFAIGNATVGDTVYVKSGSYRETLQINTSLSLIGENRDMTIIESADTYESVVVINQDHVTIAGFTIRNALGSATHGITLYPHVGNCNITGNRITGNNGGIQLISASNNRITRNIINSNAAVGITLYGASCPSTLGSDFNIITENEIFSNGVEGIVLRLSCSYNNITRNVIGSSMREGILLSWAGNNRIEENNITNNGVGAGDSGNFNAFYHNNFIGNNKQADGSWLDLVTGQIVFSEGDWSENYWSDYTGKDKNGDGRGDTPYIIDETNQDKNPLISLFDPQSVLPDLQPPTPSTTPSASSSSLCISISSPANTSYAAIGNPYTTVPLTFVANASLSWVGYSLDGGSNVTASNGTLIEIPVGSQNLTVYANDTAGNWAAPQTVYYSVAWNGGTPPPPFPWLPVAAVSVAIASVVAVAALVYWKKHKHEVEAESA